MFLLQLEHLKQGDKRKSHSLLLCKLNFLLSHFDNQSD